MKLVNKFFAWMFMCLAVAILASCGSDKASDAAGGEDGGSKSFQSEGDAESVEHLEKAKKVFFMIPSPIETVTVLKRAGAVYEPSDLNPVTNVSNYMTMRQKAMNLGIYGADLSFASIFNQTQESMFYLKVAKKLSEGVGVWDAFDESTVNRIEENIDEADSMLAIISDSYWVADAHLKEEGRENVSALIIVGGWVEGLHIACEIYKRDPSNKDIRERILEQKYSLKHLIELIESFDQDDSDIIEVKNDMKDLQSLYDALKVVQTASDHSKDQNSGVFTIGGKREIQASEEDLQKILGKVNEIRTKYIS